MQNIDQVIKYKFRSNINLKFKKFPLGHILHYDNQYVCQIPLRKFIFYKNKLGPL